MEIDEKERRTLLKDEYLLLQSNYEDFDRRSLTIKGWVAGGAITALALSFSTSYRLVIAVPIFVAIIATVFWYLEAKWKLFQYALSDRIRVIEAYFRDESDMPVKDPAPFQIYNYWFKTYVHDDPLYEYERKYRPKPIGTRLWAAARQLFVCIIYVTIIILSAISLLLLLAFPASTISR